MELSNAARVPGLMFIVYLIVANANWYDSLPEDYRQIMQDAADSEVTNQLA